MADLPYKTKILVLQQKSRNEFTIWHRTNGQGLININCDLPLEVGNWFIRDVHGFVPIEPQPHNTGQMSRKDVNMIRVHTVVVRPLPSYFDSDEGISKKKYMKYLGVSCEFGTIFVNGVQLEHMEYGVPYEMYVASFGISQSSTEAKILKAMKSIGTIWLASRQQIVPADIKDGIIFTARMRMLGVELLEIPGTIPDPPFFVENIADRRHGSAFAPRSEGSDSATRIGPGSIPLVGEVRSMTTESAPRAVAKPVLSPKKEVQPAGPYKVTQVENELEMWAERANRRERIRKKTRHIIYDNEEGRAKTLVVLQKVLQNPKLYGVFIKSFGRDFNALEQVSFPADVIASRRRPE